MKEDTTELGGGVSSFFSRFGRQKPRVHIFLEWSILDDGADAALSYPCHQTTLVSLFECEHPRRAVTRALDFEKSPFMRRTHISRLFVAGCGGDLGFSRANGRLLLRAIRDRGCGSGEEQNRTDQNKMVRRAAARMDVCTSGYGSGVRFQRKRGGGLYMPFLGD